MEFSCEWIHITFLSLLLLLQTGATLTGAGVCSRIQSNTQEAITFNYTERFCCSGFEPNGLRGCKECQIGYESYGNGSKCTPCSKGHYGNKCVKSCHCQSPRIRCDIVQGCIETPNLISPTAINGDTKSTTAANTAHSQENHNYVIVYMCSITGTGILLVAIFTILKIRRGKQLSLESAGKLFRIQNTTKWNLLHKKSTELHCNVYDYIDEKADIKRQLQRTLSALFSLPNIKMDHKVIFSDISPAVHFLHDIVIEKQMF